MNQKKWQDSIKKTSQDLNVEEEFILALVTAYYKAVRKELTSINKTRVEIRGLGYFDLKYFKVKYKLRDTISFIQHHSKSDSIRSLVILQNLNRKLEILEKAQKLSEKRAYDIEKTRKERREYILKNKKSLEK